MQERKASPAAVYGLGFLEGGTNSQPHGVNADGSVAVGNADREVVGTLFICARDIPNHGLPPFVHMDVLNSNEL